MLNSCIFRARVLALSRYNKNHLHTSCVLNDKRWRIKNGLPAHKTQFGPLTDLPDYTFLDGRPTPLGTHQYLRAKKQEELATKMVNLISEIDFAVERHEKLTKEKDEEKKQVIKGWLKEKGSKVKYRRNTK